MATSFQRGDAYPEADIPLPRLRTICHLWTCAAVLAGIGVAALALDVPLAAWVQSGRCPDALEKICSLGEVFSHGLGVISIVVVVAVLDPWHRYAIPRILAAALGSGMLANLFKLILARTRPHHFNLQDGGLEAFSDWFPMLTNNSWQQSFPSSHAATAAGLAIVLACFYPRGRWLFPVIAGIAGAQRVLDASHFLSDVFWGAAIGCIFAPLCVYGSRLSRAFDRLEEWLLVRRSVSRNLQGPHRRTEKAIHHGPTPGEVRAA